jgi:hypothetical protein
MRPLNILLFLLVVCFATVMQAQTPAPKSGPKQRVQPAEWEHVTFKSETGKDEDVMVLRIWNSSAGQPKWPQLALLRLPPTVYKEFRKDALALKAFIDGTQTGKPIFKDPVTITENCKFPEAEDEKSAEEVSWMVIIDHRQSRCSCTALRELARPMGH